MGPEALLQTLDGLLRGFAIIGVPAKQRLGQTAGCFRRGWQQLQRLAIGRLRILVSLPRHGGFRRGDIGDELQPHLRLVQHFAHLAAQVFDAHGLQEVVIDLLLDGLLNFNTLDGGLGRDHDEWHLVQI